MKCKLDSCYVRYDGHHTLTDSLCACRCHGVDVNDTQVDSKEPVVKDAGR